MLNALTIDFEDWYQVPLAGIPRECWKSLDSVLPKATALMLDYLAKKEIRATFFVSGYIAERHAELIEEIAREGHEIESHGYWHQLAYEQTPSEFREDIKRSTQVILDITNKKPLGYRAPAWSTSRIPDLAAEVLIQNDYVYDSSLFPIRSFLFGDSSFPTDVYFYKNTDLFEIPPSVVEFGKFRLPATGGFFMRTFPNVLMKKLIHLVNKRRPAVLYLHPWEVCADYPRMKLPIHRYFIQYYGCGNILDKLTVLLDEFKMGSMKQAFPQIQLCKQQSIDRRSHNEGLL